MSTTVPKLEVHNATKNFGNLRAVSGVSMRVESGELRAIIGPNGAGKIGRASCRERVYHPV